MCFSASASFTAAAILVPIGTYTSHRTFHERRAHFPLSLIPLLFGIQQALEGIVWLEVDKKSDLMISAAVGFLFFAFFLWPCWIPFSAFRVEENLKRKKLFYHLTLIAAVFGASLFAPFVVNTSEWLEVCVISHSLKYQAAKDILIPRFLAEIIYFLLVISPLVFSSDRRLKIFGVFFLIGLALAYGFYHYVFISMWCFFAAALSLILPYLLFIFKGGNYDFKK